ncbi:tyrosine-type recombinase/integrase [Methylobacterium radiodurans]|uniref:tyrosine-type recombinase/integrase n=1 Tax=Methylobacterium radiodurans TaxID=2202828 RepID=UPI001FE7D99C|nr:site-specific integrase [Methylobacterium radiodurans]
MPEYKLQRFRGGWAVAVYKGGKRLSRRQLECRDAAGAAAEFGRVVEDAQRPVDPTVRTIWEGYIAAKVGRRIAENMGWTGKAVLAFFGDRKPAEITEKLCQAYTAERRAAKRGSKQQQDRFAAKGRAVPIGVTNGTIRTELNQLRAALLWAEKANMIARAPAIEMPSAPQARERHLTRPEFDRLLDTAETPHLRLYLLLAISTAGRNAALLELTWDRVDFERGLVFLGPRHSLRPQKGRATVPMTNTLRAALANALAHRRTEHVIEWGGEPVKSVRTALGKAAKRAGLPNLTPHMLRHTAACWLAEAGRPMTEIAAFLGHADDLITQRVYARFSPSHLRQTADALEVGRARTVR